MGVTVETRGTYSGEARGHACHAKHDQKSPE